MDKFMNKYIGICLIVLVVLLLINQLFNTPIISTDNNKENKAKIEQLRDSLRESEKRVDILNHQYIELIGKYDSITTHKKIVYVEKINSYPTLGIDDNISVFTEYLSEEDYFGQ